MSKPSIGFRTRSPLRQYATQHIFDTTHQYLFDWFRIEWQTKPNQTTQSHQTNHPLFLNYHKYNYLFKCETAHPRKGHDKARGLKG